MNHKNQSEPIGRLPMHRRVSSRQCHLANRLPSLVHCRGVALLLATCCLGHTLVAQEQPVPQKQPLPSPAASQSEQSDLTRGLLELLGEPKADMPADKPAPAISPSEIGLDGEDLGEQSANPLESVRQSMLIAAKFLQQGSIGQETQQLQGDIVQRLDELISELENSKSSQSNKSQSNQSQSTSAADNRTQQDPGEQEESTQKPASTSDEPQQPAAADASSSNSGQKGLAGEAVVDLADPKALQESVWGHLPERIRTQMQSRMVEQFLPSYREQIEAYFQALLEQDGR